MAKHSTKTAAVAAGAMLFDKWFDPIEDARARREFWLCCRDIVYDTRPHRARRGSLSGLAMFLMVAYGKSVEPPRIFYFAP
jgi:hypothetical protein